MFSKKVLGRAPFASSSSKEQERLGSNHVSFESLHEFSRLSEEEEVLDTFCERQLRFIIEQSRKRNMTIRKVFESLKLAIDTHEKETTRLEAGMDKALFKRILLSGDIFRSGTEKRTNRQITWIDTAGLFDSSWKYRRDSPKGKAWVRALISIMEAAYSLAWSVPDQDVHPVFFIHDGDRRILDFNSVLLVEAAKTIATIFPAENESFRIAGMSSFSGTMIHIVTNTLGRRAKTWTFEDTIEDFKSFVQDKTDVPEMFSSRGCKGKPFSADDPVQRMFLDRILDGPKLNLKEVLNPGPWLHPPFDCSALGLDETKPNQNLEIIEEGDEEDGEW